MVDELIVVEGADAVVAVHSSGFQTVGIHVLYRLTTFVCMIITVEKKYQVYPQQLRCFIFERNQYCNYPNDI